MANFSASKNTGDTLTAAEWNQTGSINNLIQSTGQVLSDADLNQSGKAAAQYGSGNFFTDSGAANAYILSPIGSMQSAAAYFDGMEVRFRAANASSAASTVNVNSLGSKNIKKADGVTDITTEISTTADSILRFDNANDCFIYDVGINAATTTAAGLSLLSSLITLQNNATDPSNDMDFSAGVMQFDDGSGQVATTAITKQLDANFAAGTNQGGLDTGTKAADTTYHCFSIYNPTTGATDALFSTSLTSPALPAGFTKKKRVGSIITNASSDIIEEIRVGNQIFYKSPILDVNTTVNTIRSLHTLTIPDGIECLTFLNLYRGSEASYYICSPEATDLAPSTTTSPLFSIGNIIGTGGDNEMGSSTFTVMSNTSRQIAARSNGAASTLRCATLGYTDLNL